MSVQKLNVLKLLSVNLMLKRKEIKYRRYTEWYGIIIHYNSCCTKPSETNIELFSQQRNIHPLEDQYFQKKLEQFQTSFTVYNFFTTYTGTFTYSPADREWLSEPLKNLLQSCPEHHHSEVKYCLRS